MCDLCDCQQQDSVLTHDWLSVKCQPSFYSAAVPRCLFGGGCGFCVLRGSCIIRSRLIAPFSVCASVMGDVGCSVLLFCSPSVACGLPGSRLLLFFLSAAGGVVAAVFVVASASAADLVVGVVILAVLVLLFLLMVIFVAVGHNFLNYHSEH